MLQTLVTQLEILRKDLNFTYLNVKLVPHPNRLVLELNWRPEEGQNLTFCWLKKEIAENSAFGIEDLCSMLREKLLKK